MNYAIRDVSDVAKALVATVKAMQVKPYVAGQTNKYGLPHYQDLMMGVLPQSHPLQGNAMHVPF